MLFTGGGFASTSGYIIWPVRINKFEREVVAFIPGQAKNPFAIVRGNSVPEFIYNVRPGSSCLHVKVEILIVRRVASNRNLPIFLLEGE